MKLVQIVYSKDSNKLVPSKTCTAKQFVEEFYSLFDNTDEILTHRYFILNVDDVNESAATDQREFTIELHDFIVKNKDCLSVLKLVNKAENDSADLQQNFWESVSPTLWESFSQNFWEEAACCFKHELKSLTNSI